MQNKKFFYLAMFLIILIVNIAFGQDTIKKYSEKKRNELMLSQLKREGNFAFVVMPYSVEIAIANSYSDWEEKRYSYKKKILKAKEIKNVYKNILHAFLFINFTGEWDSKGKTSLKIPDDIAEYIFLENDKGKFVRCNRASISLMAGTVNMFNESTAIPLEFSLKCPQTNESILKNTKKIKFKVGGLGFKNNKFEYEVPFSKLFSDAPESLKKIYYEIGLWKKGVK